MTILLALIAAGAWPRAARPDPSPPGPAASAIAEGQGFKEEIVVTGSRIRRKDLTTAAPVTIISREEFLASGKTSLGDFLQTLPFQGNATNTAFNGSDGTTRINLRSLGAQRTLVLVNGRRFVSSGLGADHAVDLDTIPSSAVERIEILKDGASAIYGSDAIAGVVNIITRKKFEGVELGAVTGLTTHGDGRTLDFSATTGASSERGRLFATFGFYDQQPIWAGDRGFSAVPRGYDAHSGEYTYGSSTTPNGRVALPSNASGALPAALGNDYPGTTYFTPDPSSSHGWRPYSTADEYNYMTANYLVTAQRRFSLFTSADHKLDERTRAFFEGSFVNRHSEHVLAPTPLVLGSGGATYDGADITISKDSIYNPFGVDLTEVSRRLSEFGNRVYTQDVNTYRLVGGLDGTLGDRFGRLRNWTWDASLNFGRSTASQSWTGGIRTDKLAEALGPSMIIDGKPTCVRVANDPSTAIAGCVPLNLLGGAGSITSDMISSLAYTGSSYGTNQLTALQLNTNGDLFRLASDRPIGLAMGYEFRRVVGSFTPDDVTASGNTTEGALAKTAGAYNVNEIYGELLLPILSHRSFVDDLELSAAIRAFHYSNFGDDFTYKFGARWRIIPDVTLRGTYSTAFRAPSIAELYQGKLSSAERTTDPCASASTAPASCGTAAGNGDDSKQLNVITGGNPYLQPEHARTYTLGIVLEPRWAKRLSVTFDYFDVKIDQAITTLGAAVILSECYPAQASQTPKYCDLVTRDASGRISSITDLYANVGAEEESGVDIAVRYALPTPTAGRFDFSIDATWLRNHDVTLPDGTVIHGRGTYDLASLGSGGIEGVNPAWKFNAGVRWAREPLSANLNMRFIGSFRECGDSSGDYSGGGLCYKDSTYSRQVDAWTSWNAYVGYAFTTRAGHSTVGLGVNNLFDTDPPTIYNAAIGAVDPTAYDVSGRFIYLRATHAL